MPAVLRDVLFHYTTVQGALGILESQNLYATHVRYLNDISELDHYKGFIFHELIELSNKLRKDNERLFSYIRMIASEFAAAVVGEVENLVDIYILSFSIPRTNFVRTNGLLSQWRSYGADGGVAIEFDQQGFDELLRQQGGRSENLYRAGRVTYGDDEAKIVEMREVFRRELSEHFESLVYRLYAERKETTSESLRETMSKVLKGDFQIYIDLLAKISEWAVFFKHEGFQEECEYRVSVQRPLFPGYHDERVYFRIHRGIPIPYILLLTEPSKLPVRRLIIGPHRDAKSRLAAFEKVVDRKGIKASIDLSMIPFV